MYRHEGALCETENTTNGVKSNINDPSVPNFVRRTSMRDMLNLGDVDDLIEAQEDVNEAKLSTSNYRCQGRGIPIPLSPSKDEGPIVGKSLKKTPIFFNAMNSFTFVDIINIITSHYIWLFNDIAIFKLHKFELFNICTNIRITDRN